LKGNSLISSMSLCSSYNNLCAWASAGNVNISIIIAIKAYVRKTCGDISTLWILISSSWFHTFNFMNSHFQHMEFTNSQSQLHEFVISTSWIRNFNFMNSQFQLHEYTISTTWIHKKNKIAFEKNAMPPH
jgi:hypothetical protein